MFARVCLCEDPGGLFTFDNHLSRVRGRVTEGLLQCRAMAQRSGLYKGADIRLSLSIA